MSIDIAFLSKIIGGLLAASTASYGGWVAYDVNNPTFHRFITDQGWEWSPIDGDMKISESWGLDRAAAAGRMGGDWRCTKQLFNGLTPPSTDTSGADKGNNDGHETPAKITVTDSDWQDNNPLGCLVADLGYMPGGKRNGFIKWELALRSGNRGFIYVGYLSFGATKNTDGDDSTDNHEQISFAVAFEVSKQSDTWKIGKGFSWVDLLINSQDANTNSKVTITLPNEHKWETTGNMCDRENGCSDLEKWNFHKWVGFWEQKSDGDKQPTDALDIQVGEKQTDKNNQHDIWRTPEFDFKTSNQMSGNSTAWSSSISQWYDDAESKWKETKGGQGDKGSLEEIYKPWAKKKGEWKEASQVCYQSNSRHIIEEESQRLLNFCYQNKNDKVK